jgi:uncharacterized protein
MSIRKRLIKRFARESKQHKADQSSWLGIISRGRNVYHFGRRPVAGGVALGIFLAFIPVPVQMLLAAPMAFFFRVNLPVSMAATWVSNPLTLAPILLLSFKVGLLLIGGSDKFFIEEFTASVDWFISTAGDIWLPLLVGSIACGLVAALASYTAVMWAWRLNILTVKKKKLIRKKA